DEIAVQTPSFGRGLALNSVPSPCFPHHSHPKNKWIRPIFFCILPAVKTTIATGRLSGISGTNGGESIGGLYESDAKSGVNINRTFGQRYVAGD
ncbi:MAG: hypothetical protein KDH97_01185, partial [Calditrichaeota bacterium]|nr:hypothetical protein [Calditrichota bacterium]